MTQPGEVHVAHSETTTGHAADMELGADEGLAAEPVARRRIERSDRGRPDLLYADSARAAYDAAENPEDVLANRRELTVRRIRTAAMHLALFGKNSRPTRVQVVDFLRRKGFAGWQFDETMEREFDGDVAEVFGQAEQAARQINPYTTPRKRPKIKRVKPPLPSILSRSVEPATSPTDGQTVDPIDNPFRHRHSTSIASLVGANATEGLYAQYGLTSPDPLDLSPDDSDITGLPDLWMLSPRALAEQLIDTRLFPEILRPPHREASATPINLILLAADRAAFEGEEHELEPDERLLLNILLLYRYSEITKAEVEAALPLDRLHAANRALRSKLNTKGRGAIERRNLRDGKGYGIVAPVRIMDIRRQDDYISDPTPLLT